VADFAKRDPVKFDAKALLDSTASRAARERHHGVETAAEDLEDLDLNSYGLDEGDDDLLELHPALGGSIGSVHFDLAPKSTSDADSGTAVPSTASAPASSSGLASNPFGLSAEGAAALAKRARPKDVTKRMAAGETWEDKKLTEWPENDFRLFVGHLAKDTTTAMLAKAFSQYPSFARAYAPWS